MEIAAFEIGHVSNQIHLPPSEAIFAPHYSYLMIFYSVVFSQCLATTP